MFFFPFSKAGRRQRITSRPFPSDWLSALKAYVPYFQLLTHEDQEELKNHIKVFLSEKRFIGAQGLEVTATMRVVIAAEACMLLLHREATYFPKMDTIVLYPVTYVGTARERTDYGVITEHPQARLGESSADTGMVVLAWDDVLKGARNIHDGQNVVLHEFAHQLDSENGPTDGAPVLTTRAQYATWAKVLSREYEELIRAVAHEHKTVLDAYGATNPAEFFAVATETFFEKPLQMQEKHPALYQELLNFYRQDPAALFQGKSERG